MRRTGLLEKRGPVDKTALVGAIDPPRTTFGASAGSREPSRTTFHSAAHPGWVDFAALGIDFAAHGQCFRGFRCAGPSSNDIWRLGWLERAFSSDFLLRSSLWLGRFGCCAWPVFSLISLRRASVSPDRFGCLNFALGWPGAPNVTCGFANMTTPTAIRDDQRGASPCRLNAGCIGETGIERHLWLCHCDNTQ